MKYYYDVVLSFAGEDREYVEECADILTALGIKVFYDSYEQDVLWGKDLYVHLTHIYRDNSKYCLMFISKYYAQKQWTSHERKIAQSRVFKENEEYMLPLRLDDTNIDGILDTTNCWTCYFNFDTFKFYYKNKKYIMSLCPK